MKTLGKKNFWIIIVLGVLGQIAWGLENNWFNTYTYDVITTNPAPIAWMNGASAITATITTFVMGTLSDRVGKRKPFIKYGYIIWGLFTGGFIICQYMSTLAGKIFMVVFLDCVMTFFGSTANDACLNAWTTDISNQTNRGLVTSLMQMAPLISGLILAAAGVIIDNFGYSVFFVSVGLLVSISGLIAGSLLEDDPGLKPNKNANRNLLKEIIESFKPESIRQNKKLFLILGSLCVLLIAFQIAYPYEMIYANQYLNIPKTTATLLTALGLPVMVAASFVAGKRCDQNKGTVLLWISPLLLCIGSVLHGLSKSIPLVLVARAFIYAGWMMMTVTATAMFKNLTPETSRGRYEGVRMIFVVMLPMIIGPQIGATLISKYGVGPAIYYAAAVVVLITYVVLLILNKYQND